MAELITITLPTELTEKVRACARSYGRSVEEVITQWIGDAAESELLRAILAEGPFPILTPYCNDPAAAALFQALSEAEP